MIQINRNQNIPHQSALDSKQQCRTKDSGSYPERQKKKMKINKPKSLLLINLIISVQDVSICTRQTRTEAGAVGAGDKSRHGKSNTTKQLSWNGCHNSELVESLMFFMDTLLGPPPQKHKPLWPYMVVPRAR